MGSEVTHYVMYGLKLEKSDNDPRFETLCNPELCDSNYYDNPYEEGVTETKTGIHIIVDGMNGKYVVAGVILGKADYNGFDTFVECNEPRESAHKIITALEVLNIDCQMKELGVYTFSHWY